MRANVLLNVQIQTRFTTTVKLRRVQALALNQAEFVNDVLKSVFVRKDTYWMKPLASVLKKTVVRRLKQTDTS